jgi:hypothetical protein
MPVRGPVTLGAAFALRGVNACSWRVGSAGISKTFSFAGGSYTMSSFENTLVSPAREYVTAAAPSVEFRFGWDGTTLTGASGGWSCASGQVTRVDAGGEPALQLDVTLARPTVQVVKHYVIYPRVALIREWTDYVNTDTAAHRLTRPSFLEQKVMGDAAGAGDTDLYYMDGSYQYTLEKVPLGAKYAQTFASYTGTSFSETSARYEPWFSLFDRQSSDGVYMGYDYFGNWAAPIGRRDGSGESLSLNIPNYDDPVAPGQVVDSPKAFTGVYKSDLDDMTNRLLTWQYAYLWDYTRAPWFTAVRDEGPDYLVGDGDIPGMTQMTFGQIDTMRSIGVDTFHHDYGWWDRVGDWNGPDWKTVHDYLAKSQMSQIIYYFAYLAFPGSQVRDQHPDWFPADVGGCGPIDLASAAPRAWMENLLISNAARWGDYEWRDDACPMGNWSGARQLAQDQGFRAALQAFLDARPGSGFHGVNSGGQDFGYDWLRFADGTSMTDFNSFPSRESGGYTQQWGGSMLYPVDKLSGVPEAWPVDTCDARYDVNLMWNPDLQGDTVNPAALECTRKVIDLYHYITAQGVAGRWVQQFHPHGTDVDTNWFERLSGDGKRGLVIYKGEDSQSPVTVYPKGLDPRRTYDVRFEYQAGSSRRSGADLMSNGVSFPSIGIGELIWLNLPNHPGSGTDHSAPSAPADVSATAGTNMSFRGVDVSWTKGEDNNWVSCYEVLRDGKVLAKVGKGTFYFDHSPGATPDAAYAVRAIDGDGNTSPLTSTYGRGTTTTTVDDASPAITYTGTWAHQTGIPGPAEGTVSQGSGQACRTACQQFSDTQGTERWSYQNGGAGPCHQACQQFSDTQGTERWSYQSGGAGPCHQACQQFSDTQGTDGWGYEDGPPPPPLPCHLACQQFSDTQGANGWSYQTSTNGQWSDITTYRNFGQGGDCCSWLDLSFDQASGTVDSSGLVSQRFMLPGIGHDVARAWTAPKDGVVDIAAQAIARTSYPLVLTITDNGQPVQGPRTLDGSMSTVDTSVPNVTVAVGDVIRFEVQGIDTFDFSALLQWDPDIQYHGDPPVPPAGPPPGVFTGIATYHAGEDFSGDGPFWSDGIGTVSARQVQPGSDRDVARSWTAPSDGVVDITGRVAETAQDWDKPAVVSITKNYQVIWGPQEIAARDVTGLDSAVPAVTVASGDVIRFQVAAGSGIVTWDPDVTYQGQQPVPVVVPPWTDMAAYHGGEDFNGDGPFWSDGTGTVSARQVQSGFYRDAARVWTAPRDGTVDIAGHVSGGGKVSITKNDQVIWGPDSTGDADASVAGVTVAAGDVIRFRVAAGGATVKWDPDVTYQGEQPLPVVVPPWTDMAAYHGGEDFNGDGPFWSDGTGTVSARQVQSGTYRDAARVWTAPRDGTVDIAGHVSGGGEVSITKNDQVIWGPDSTGDADASVAGVTVAAGDVIRFRVAAGGATVRWDPDVSYQGDPVPAVVADSASWTFTGSQVTWYAQLGSDKGVAEVLIDGKLDARIDLYAPNTNNWSVPIYTRTFPALGTHTIIIRSAGWSNNSSSTGIGVAVDGFQASGTAPAVAEDTSRNIAFTGTGWQGAAQTAASGGHITASSHAGDTVSYTFTGRSVTWVSRLCTSCGEADVYLDGRYVTRVDTFGDRGARVWQAAAFEHSWPDKGRHTLTIVVDGIKNLNSTGTEIAADSFQVAASVHGT